ncbi:MAG: 4-hydroxy-3-methylbut-2-en-1-yl diphosphate synthase [Flavobacteriia bacterium]|nr:4-hydroxy-3-methylbut-2-en-1-yl diphosphate synthase [Flavobacteriia bacterium]
MDYCNQLFVKSRLKTENVHIGNTNIGGDHPILVQSMTTADTMNTEASVAEAIRMIDAGCELVRLTAPSKNEAENLFHIKQALEKEGYSQPLVADIHFTPNAAEIAAKYVEKIRVNPGNYADKKKFDTIHYTDETYLSELKRIEEKFTPLVLICKEHNRAMRIGTNHGSLSDRILSRYGDTAEGMVASAMEFIQICEKNHFFNLVISMKASNTLIMVYAYRLLVSELKKTGKVYPLHLGVTEAGDGEDGRIKSAVGIGALLTDGIGDTIRVSLTEAPEMEIPVAQKLIAIANQTNVYAFDATKLELNHNPVAYTRRETHAIQRIGGGQVPVVIADLSNKKDIIPANLFAFGYVYSASLDKWNILETAADFLYVGNQTLSFALPGTLQVLVDGSLWLEQHQNDQGFYPIVPINERASYPLEQVVFCLVKAEEFTEQMQLGKADVLVIQTDFDNKVQLFRSVFAKLGRTSQNTPVVFLFDSEAEDSEAFQLQISMDAGAMFVDGYGDGIWVTAKHQPNTLVNSTMFGVLQATRQRISKTEYISCPSCGRTLFDLQETTAKIRNKTSHLKGLKIGIMGCIVNGPGEMADADYGYVGTGPGKINLYKEKTVVRKNVDAEDAVAALIDVIKENGDWIEPKED